MYSFRTTHLLAVLFQVRANYRRMYYLYTRGFTTRRGIIDHHTCHMYISKLVLRSTLSVDKYVGNQLRINTADAVIHSIAYLERHKVCKYDIIN